MSELTIEKDVPRPKPYGPRTPATRAASRLKVGDSFVCATEAELLAARNTIKRNGGRISQRKIPEGWRIWRIA